MHGCLERMGRPQTRHPVRENRISARLAGACASTGELGTGKHAGWRSPPPHSKRITSSSQRHGKTRQGRWNRLRFHPGGPPAGVGASVPSRRRAEGACPWGRVGRLVALEAARKNQARGHPASGSAAGLGGAWAAQAMDEHAQCRARADRVRVSPWREPFLRERQRWSTRRHRRYRGVQSGIGGGGRKGQRLVVRFSSCAPVFEGEKQDAVRRQLCCGVRVANGENWRPWRGPARCRSST